VGESHVVYGIMRTKNDAGRSCWGGRPSGSIAYSASTSISSSQGHNVTHTSCFNDPSTPLINTNQSCRGAPLQGSVSRPLREFAAVQSPDSDFAGEE